MFSLSERDFVDMAARRSFHGKQMEYMKEDLHFSEEEKETVRKAYPDVAKYGAEWNYYDLKRYKLKDGLMVCREGTDYETVYMDDKGGYGLFFAVKCAPGDSRYYWGYISEDDGNLYIPESIGDQKETCEPPDLRHCLKGIIWKESVLMEKLEAFSSFTKLAAWKLPGLQPGRGNATRT